VEVRRRKSDLVCINSFLFVADFVADGKGIPSACYKKSQEIKENRNTVPSHTVEVAGSNPAPPNISRATARTYDKVTGVTIEPLSEGRVRFIQRERFGGLLLPLLSKTLDGDPRRGFEEMNRTLKLRSESAA
jgi:hypothetical protein